MHIHVHIKENVIILVVEKCYNFLINEIGPIEPIKLVNAFIAGLVYCST